MTLPADTPERRAHPEAPRRLFKAVVRGVTKPVRPHQLAVELGGADIFTAGGDPEGTDPTVFLADIDQAALEAAIEAHVRDPWCGWPEPLRHLASLGAHSDPHIQALVDVVLSANPRAAGI